MKKKVLICLAFGFAVAGWCIGKPSNPANASALTSGLNEANEIVQTRTVVFLTVKAWR